MWALGDYPDVATEVVPSLGAGNAAIPAARTGAAVWATDLTPELLDLTWRVDVEALPCTAAEYDVVMSCVGVMFAPHHEASAAELLRVCRGFLDFFKAKYGPTIAAYKGWPATRSGSPPWTAS